MPEEITAETRAELLAMSRDELMGLLGYGRPECDTCADEGQDDEGHPCPACATEQEIVDDLLDRLPEVDRHWPVVVTETHRYVLFIEAETAEEAVRLYKGDPYDPGRADQMDFDWSADPADDIDWRDIAHGGDWWPGMRHDAHVHAWRSAGSPEAPPAEPGRAVETIAPVGGVL